MAQNLGIVKIIWRGANIKIEKNTANLTLGGLVQEPVVTGLTVGFFNVFKESTIEATSVVERGTSITALYAPGQGELQVQCDTGQSYVWPDAFMADTAKFSAGGGGKLKLKWNAGSPTEILNG